MAIPLCYNPIEDPLSHGELSDVWKGRYRGREVAAKVIRANSTSDFKGIAKVRS